MGTILLAFDRNALPEAQIAQIQSIAPDMRLLITHDRKEIEKALDEIEIAVGGFPLDLIPKARNLRWFQQWSAGADWLMRHPEVVEMNFILTNASGVHAIPISEHILAFMLTFSRRLHRAIRAQAHRRWAFPGREEIFELAGKTMVLVGVGAIGSRTAKIASALGMRVLGVRRNPSLGKVPGVEAIFGPGQLLDLLPEADFLVLAVPLTHETQGMIGERELRAMKPTAYLINIGRGGTVQEEVLIRALREGWIAGAGLDVFEREPLPEDSPLWTMDNVIITSHCSGRTPHYYERAMAIFLDNLQRYRAGKPLRNVVDKRLGY